MSEAAERPRGAIRPDARVLAVGATGTGKSTILRWLFATQFGPRSGHARRVLIDPGDAYELVPEKGSQEVRASDVRRGTVDWDAPLTRIVPGTDPKVWESIYSKLNTLPNTCVWLDEAQAAPHPQTHPGRALRDYQTLGRKYRRAHLVAAQFPAAIDRTFVDQAEHVFCFTLRRPEDRDRIAKMIGLRNGDALAAMFAGWPAGADGRPSHHFLWRDDVRNSNAERSPLPAQAIKAADRVVRAVV